MRTIFIFALFLTASSHQQAALNVVVDGNSLCTSMYGVRAMTFYLSKASARDIQLTNICVGGATTPQLATGASSRVDSRLLPGAVNVLVFWEGSNDLYFGATPEAAYANLRSYAQARRAAGWRVAILTLLPRWNPETPADFEASRQYVNYMLRVNWADYADALIDVGADHVMGQRDTIWSSQWYQAFDHTHLAEGGSQRIGKIVGLELQPLLR